MTVITTETLGPLSQEPTPAEAQAHAERRERFRIAGQSALDRSRGGRDLEPEARAWALEVDVVCSVPKSATKRFAADALTGRARPTKKPDADNVLKAICDGMNGVVWKDDLQAVDIRVSKRYGQTPGVHVRVAALEAA